jgi:mannose-6-phosphate isomerase-like protein (cupin superfamily)
MTDLGSGVHVTRPASDDYRTEENVLPARETIVVLQGTVRIEIDDGPTLDLTAGDVASMPKGATTYWHPSPAFPGSLGVQLNAGPPEVQS